MDGFQSIPLPFGGQELLDDSLPIIIPIPLPPEPPVGTITIVIHGHLFGELNPVPGTADPTSLEWSTWGSEDTVIMAEVETVDLTMETAYNVYFTVTVSVGTFPLANKDTHPAAEFPGDPPVIFVIPEFLSQMFFIMSIIATIFIIVIHKWCMSYT